MAADEEFNLEDKNMLLPYIRDQGDMNACYSYSSGEAVQALHASTYSVDPFELSTQQIVDHLPRMFDYENRRKRKDLLGCYYSNHPDVLHYIWQEGLVKDEHYVKRQSRKEEDVLPIPNVTKYGIRSFEYVFQIGMPLHLKKGYETEKTIEEINNIIREQPMIGATKIYRSFWFFRGEGVYMGPDANEEPKEILHSILIVGFGINNGVQFYKIKNSCGIRWGHQGFGKIRRELVYRLAYPIGPIEKKVKPVKVAPSVTKIKNTNPSRSKRHGSSSKHFQSKASGPTQFGAQGKRFGTEAVTTRMQPTHDDIDDFNEAKKRFKTNALWGVELKPGKPFTHNFEKEQGRLHVSEAMLSTGSTSMTSLVQCQVGDKKPICMCSLVPEKQETCPLNLEFEEDHEDVTFLVIGSHNVNLSGFFYGEHEDCFGDEYGSDPYEEDVADTDCAIEFEYDTEDGSTGNDFIMYPPSRVPNSTGVKIEEILEDGKPTDEKKRKNQLNVTDDIENSILVKCNTDSPLLESEDEDGFAPRESKSKRSEEAQNDTAADEMKGIKRIVCDDTSKANDYQRGDNAKQNKKKKVMIDPGHVEANDEATDQDGWSQG